MIDLARTAYIVRDGDLDYLCVQDGEGTFYRFRITQGTRARLGAECAESLLTDIQRGNYGAAPDA